MHRDFWRGAIDGDGTVSVKRQYGKPVPYLSLCGASLELIEQFRRYVLTVIPDTKAKPYKSKLGLNVFMLGNSYAVRMIDHLYGNAAVTLDRKAERAAAIVKQFGPKYGLGGIVGGDEFERRTRPPSNAVENQECLASPVGNGTLFGELD